VNHLLYLQDKATYRKAGKELRGLSADPRNAIYRADWIPDSSKRNMVGEIEAIPEAGRSTRRRRAYEQGSPLDQFRDRMVLRYEILRDGKRVLLSGINERSDSIRVLLDRVDKPYLLPETKFAGGQY
jgi:hypothetical protein